MGGGVTPSPTRISLDAVERRQRGQKCSALAALADELLSLASLSASRSRLVALVSFRAPTGAQSARLGVSGASDAPAASEAAQRKPDRGRGMGRWGRGEVAGGEESGERAVGFERGEGKTGERGAEGAEGEGR